LEVILLESRSKSSHLGRRVLGVELPPWKIPPINLSYSDALPIWFIMTAMLNTALWVVKYHSKHWIDLAINLPIRRIKESLSQSNSMATRSRQHSISDCVEEDEKNSKHYQLTENWAEGEEDEKSTNEDTTTNCKKGRMQRQKKN
jgi:hypothetical protein